MLLHSTYYQEPDTFSPEQTTAGTWRTRRRPDSSLLMGEKFLLAPIRRCPDTCPRPLPPLPPSSRPCTRVGSLQTRGLAASQTTAPDSYLDGSLKRNRHFLFRKETFRRTTWRVKKSRRARMKEQICSGSVEQEHAVWSRLLQEVKIRQTKKHENLMF